MGEIRVGLVGYAFMGRAHSNAYRQIPFYFPEIESQPVLKVLCGRSPEPLQQAAAAMGWEDTETDFDTLVARDDIDLIDITTPNNVHVEMAIKAAQAGKHVFCEKPLAMNLAEARQAQEAVEEAGVVNMICHNYRRAPAVSLAKQMIDDGALGTIYHWRSQYLQDWLVDPQAPAVWRTQKGIAGSGALGDLLAHSIDLALWLVGDIDQVCCDMETFIEERPPLGSIDATLGARAGAGEKVKVDVDDGVVALARFANGALGTMEATRFAPGHRNYNFFEINGSGGSLRFNLERMNELEYYDCDDPDGQQGFRVIQATEGVHPFMGVPDDGGRYWPPGHIIGYEHTFINTVADLLKGIEAGESPAPTFADAVKTQAILEACEDSADEGGWIEVEKL